MRVVASEYLGGTRGTQKVSGRDLDAGLAVGRNDALVVGELAFNQSTGDLRLAEREVHLVAVRGGVDGHLVIVGRVPEQAANLVERLGRHDHLELGTAVGQLDGAHRKPKPVGGGQRERGAAHLQQRAGQYGPRVIGRRREDDFVDGLLQQSGRDRKARPAAHRGDRRKVLGVDAGNVRLEATARQMHFVRLRVQLELDLLAVVEQGHVVGDKARGQRDLAFATDRRGHTVRDRQLEIVGGELQLAITRRK